MGLKSSRSDSRNAAVSFSAARAHAVASCSVLSVQQSAATCSRDHETASWVSVDERLRGLKGRGVGGGVTGARALPLERAVPSLPVQTSPGPATELSSARKPRPLPVRSLRNESEGRQCHVLNVPSRFSRLCLSWVDGQKIEGDYF